MSVTAAHTARFFDEIVAHGTVWSIRDDDGFPTSTSPLGETAMPFWSSDSRAQKVIDNVSAYRGFKTSRLALSEFVDRWLPGLERDGLFVGINWSGKRATGYDMTPETVRNRIAMKQTATVSGH
ncbi:DUF2750 domain-containing protein [Pararhizobium sp.]|uniref:DUF2750 domain-containing protein n=1 Tax=Pararhizobium sp. TaxID=1977563 RepID=UPI003D09B077